MAGRTNKFIDHVQVALFPNELIINNSTLLAVKTIEKINGLDESSIDTTDLPPDFPPTAARLSFKYTQKDNIETKVSVSPAKVDLFWSNAGLKPTFKPIELKNKVIEVIELLEEIKPGLTFNRIGYTTSILSLTQEPVVTLEKLLSAKLTTRGLIETGFVLTYNLQSPELKKIFGGSTKFNEHVRINDTSLIRNPKEKAISIVYDLNTRQKQKLAFQKKEVLEFIKWAQSQSKLGQIYDRFFKW